MVDGVERLNLTQRNDLYRDIFCAPSYRDAFLSARSIPPTAMQFWVDHACSIVRSMGRSSPLVVDLGSGPGRFAIPLAKALKSLDGRVLAIDSSPAALSYLDAESARHHLHNIKTSAQDLTGFSTNEPADLYFASEVLHSVASVEAVMRRAQMHASACAAFVIRAPSHKQLREILWLNFFDRALDLDIARSVDVPHLAEMLQDIGFAKRLEVQEVVEETSQTVDEFLLPLEQKAFSILRLLSDNEYDQGMKRLRTYCSDRHMVSSGHNMTCTTAWR